MITLKVEEYCHNCPEFEPDVDKDKEEMIEYNMMSRSEVREVFCTTTVTCQHHHRCAAIYKNAAEWAEIKSKAAGTIPNGGHVANACE